MNKKIYTTRLKLRPFVPADLTGLRAIVENKEIAEMASFRVATNAFESDYFLRQLMQPNIWAMTLKQTSEVIGSIGLYPVVGDNHERDPLKLELGYMVNQDFWGYGYMTEAVQSILNHSFHENYAYVVLASTYAENKRSAAILEHLSFKKVGEHTLPVSVLNPVSRQENFYQLTAQAFIEGGHYATH